MSLNRRGCITHQKFIDLFQNIKSSTNNNKHFINNKKSHATLSLNRWKDGMTKHVYSNRLGISYDTSYTTNDSKYYYLKHNRCMYRKRFDNFNTYGHQLKNNRKTPQVIRFERACRTVFNNRSRYGKKHSPITNLEDQLARARHCRFLFLRSQYINKPINHLKYYNRPPPHIGKDYNFPIPPNNLEPRRRFIQNVLPTVNLDNQEVIDDSTPIPFEEGKTWHVKLGFMVPNELMPYVNDTPIYISSRQEKLKGKAHEPGSKGWWDGIRSRKKRHDQSKVEQDERNKRIEKVKLWNTSQKKFLYREEKSINLTSFQN
ncbi:hypothetical protein RhiirA4_519824 [Rhizophagus irregularis]|uniref:DUF8211 domain-containing protein n=1 Tax=Rhizophagus irregularis TaxID=588596 RepID=A0A2I1GIM9_9GLOM|nr:hypothetical protein RhiirA4_519824 [Rhizophagus irregularis]